MKVNFKQSLNLLLVVSALVLISCGKKENKVSSSVSSATPFSTGNDSLYTSEGSIIVNQVKSIKENMPCLTGNRLVKDVNFYVQNGSKGANRIGGTWTPGFSPQGGKINKMWIGVSAFRDLMFVTQVMNGSSVIGFNVTMSFCEMKNSYAGLPSLISNEREITAFSTPNDIIVESTARCGYNLVSLAANTQIISQKDLSNPYSTTVQVPTTFAAPACK